MPVGRAAAASAIARPRTPMRRIPSVSLRIPAATAAVTSPTECPATAVTGRLEGGERDESRRDDQRLGDVGAPDGVRVRLGAELHEIEADGLAEPLEVLARRRVLDPRREEPGRLRALAGRDDDDHRSSLPNAT